MWRHETPRHRRSDLLARPPCGARELAGGWGTLLVDPIDQLEELARLHRRGLLTSEEYERQKHTVLLVWRATE